MRAWKRSKKESPCPLCGADGWCTNSGDGAFMCQYTHGAEVAGWWIVSGVESELPAGVVDRMKRKGQRFTSKGTIYRAVGDHQERAVMSEEELEKQRVVAEKLLATRIKKAQDQFKDASENHPAAEKYFRERGVAIEDLPYGRLPRSIRCTALRSSFELPWVEDKNQRLVTGPGFIIVCAAVDDTSQWDGAPTVRAVQRIYITEDGKKMNRSLDGREVDCKITLGAVKSAGAGGKEVGAAVRLCRGYGSTSTLVSCEGIETGLGLMAAFAGEARGKLKPEQMRHGEQDDPRQVEAAVWCHISAVGLEAVSLPESDVREGRVKRWVAAGDHDRMHWRLRIKSTSGFSEHEKVSAFTEVEGQRLVEELVAKLKAEGREVEGVTALGRTGLRAVEKAVGRVRKMWAGVEARGVVPSVASTDLVGVDGGLA